MKLYLVRHGETVNNALDLNQDGTAELSELGMRQADILAERFLRIPVDVIYTSTMVRARVTAQVIGRAIGKEVIDTPVLEEKRHPSEIVGKPKDDGEVKKIRKEMDAHVHDPLWHYADEENFFDCVHRVSKFFDVLNQAGHENILAVTHNTPVRMLVYMMVFGHDIQPGEFKKFKSGFALSNTGITLCEKKDDKWVVRTFNDHSHLG